MENHTNFAKAIARLSESVAPIDSITPCITYNYPGRLKLVEGANAIFERRIIDPDLGSASPSDKKKFAAFMRIHLYELGAVSSELEVYLWTKRSVIADIGKALVHSLEGKSLLLPFILIRPILEHSGNLVIFSKKRDELKLTETTTPKEKEHKLIDYSALVAKSGKSTRIDWGTMLTTPLDTGKTKSYKPGQGTLDVTAQNLMQGIDQLDRKVKGARKAYDLASEFAHPNVGPHQIYISEDKSTIIDDYVTLYERNLSRINPFKSAEFFHKQLIEMIEIVSESIIFTKQLAEQISKDIRVLQRWSKDAIRSIVSKDPGIFHKDERCPCFSGKRYISCCGKKALVRGYQSQKMT